MRGSGGRMKKQGRRGVPLLAFAFISLRHGYILARTLRVSTMIYSEAPGWLECWSRNEMQLSGSFDLARLA